MTEFVAYIDESGDEGIGRGSRWFVLSSAIVESGRDSSSLGQKLRDIKQRIDLRKPVLHWADLSHPRKLAVCEELATAPITISSVVVDTHHPAMQQTSLVGGRLYFYAFRWLVERIMWFCGDQGGQVRLRPENKGGIRYKELTNYLTFIQSNPGCQIRPNCILDVRPMAKSQLPLLQVADTVAGAMYAAFEYQYGVTEPAYLLQLKHLLYRRTKKLWGYGIKFMPHEARQIPFELMQSYQWLTQL